MTPEATLISLAVGVIIPGVVELVSKSTASVRVKAIVSAVLAAVGGGLAQYTTGTVPVGWHQWQTVLLQIAVAAVMAVAAYLGGWQPTGLAQKVRAKTARFGIG